MRSTRTFLRHAVGTIAALATVSSLAWAQVTVPDRPAKPLFRGQQGEQRSTEIAYEPTSRTVTLKSSGGRAYADVNPISVPSIYDDIMENLRVRYVVTYVSSQPGTVAKERTVQVKLIDPKTDASLRIADTAGRRVRARVIAQASYLPAGPVTQTSGSPDREPHPESENKAEASS